MTLDEILEIIATLTGVISVIFSIRRSLWVYPSGIISTILYVYLLWKWELFGECMVNIYYTLASVYGWYNWGKHQIQAGKVEVLKMRKNQISYLVAGTSFVFSLVILLYLIVGFTRGANTWFIQPLQYLDILATTFFVVGMFLMTRRYIEHWLFWISGNFIAIVLYLLKDHPITAFQFFVFLILAVYGWKQWQSPCRGSKYH